ncbi:MAG: cyclase family protein [Acidobacteriia bacterium]|nr:cyclase family protein [Terriglobia bacterium]
MKGHGRLRVVTCLALLTIAASAGFAQQPDLPMKLLKEIAAGRIKLVDLTHPIDEQSPYWPEDHSPSPFHARVVDTYAHDNYFARALEIPEHFGTHIDAPAHFDPHGRTVDQIPVESLLRRLSLPKVLSSSASAASAPASQRFTSDASSASRFFMRS